jgi:alkylation response protein AidB-like acyl-CoA dehydrogenase
VVSGGDVLGGVSNGGAVLRYLVDRTVLGICAVEYGIAEQALFMTANYSGERKQFGVPIAVFQGVTQRVGDAYIDVQAMRSSMWQACWRLDQGLEADKELAVAKYFASEAGARVVAAAQHVHGGMGFDRDYPLYRYFMSSKHLEFTLGGTQESLTRLGELISV